MSHIIWNKRYETMPEKRKAELQLEKLKRMVRRIYDKVPFYKKAMDEAGVKPRDIHKLSDINKLPFTTKDDLAANYPFGMFASPMKDIVRIHSSSGTTGKPKVGAYTKEDIRLWAELMARTFTCAGVTRKDVIQNAYGYGLFTGGLGAHYGAERIGATVIPISGGNTKRQILVMQDFGSTVLCSTPSYALHLFEAAEEAGVDIRQLDLRVGVFGAEMWSEKMREQIESKTGITAIDIYGLTELIGPGVASECLEKNHLHVFDDHFIPEVIDPETLEPLPPGEKGELVFTNVSRKAFPILRYRTRDITALHPEPCPCGRTHVRMERVTGRSDDMLIVRGVNVYPSQIESVIMGIQGVEPHYQIVVDRQKSMDTLEIWLEVSEQLFSDEIRELEKLEARIRQELESVLLIGTKIKLVEPKTIQRSEGKAVRIVDKRNI
jgi:phenylacetate-CoA ligase